MGQVGRLIPGITTITPHARYYTLHGLVAAQAEAKDLVPEEARTLLRRAEVVLAGVSLTHKTQHSGMSAPHGGDPVWKGLKTGALDVKALSSEKRYAQARWGFWGPYLGSESTLGLVHSIKGPRPGEHLDVAAVREALGDLLPLATQDTIDTATLAAHEHLCICRAADAADGRLLRERMIPSEVRPMHPEDRRRQTLLMLLRLMDLCPQVESPQRDLSRFLAFDPAAADDPVVAAFDAYWAWVGVVLRSRSVAGWRDLWAWLVREIGDFMPIQTLGDTFADALPEGTLDSFLSDLPDTVDDAGRPLPAEDDPSVTGTNQARRCLAVLLLGARRVGHLEPRVAAYFEGPDEHWQQLTPTWMRDRAEEWADRPLRDFAIFLTEQLVARSQRLALAKASFSKKTGRFRIPTRVFVREGYIYRDSTEGGGGISLRFNTAMTVLAGLGLVERVNDQWILTDRGRAA